MGDYPQKAFEHIVYLSQTIGGRGSCTPQERQASEYAAGQMRSLGLSEVRLEPFRGVPSTYWPFCLAFGAALLGTLAGFFFPLRWVMACSALLVYSSPSLS